MKRQSKIVLGMILIVILMMGVGYAALSNVILTITGSATASANADNFKVYFTGVIPSKSSETDVNASATNGQVNATVDFTGMDTVGESQYVIFEIENGSEDIDASSVKVTLQEVDTDYIDIAAMMCEQDGSEVLGDNPVAAGQKTYVKVSATLLKNPVSDDTTTTINVQITAVPKTI